MSDDPTDVLGNTRWVSPWAQPNNAVRFIANRPERFNARGFREPVYGNVTVPGAQPGGEKSFPYVSGGAGRGAAPFGKYQFMGEKINGGGPVPNGYMFAPQADNAPAMGGGNRTQIMAHPALGGTLGCFGMSPANWAQFKAAVGDYRAKTGQWPSFEHLPSDQAANLQKTFATRVKLEGGPDLTQPAAAQPGTSGGGHDPGPTAMPGGIGYTPQRTGSAEPTGPVAPALPDISGDPYGPAPAHPVPATSSASPFVASTAPKPGPARPAGAPDISQLLAALKSPAEAPPAPEDKKSPFAGPQAQQAPKTDPLAEAHAQGMQAAQAGAQAWQQRLGQRKPLPGGLSPINDQLFGAA